jgi:hypothetical protein
MKTVVYNRRFVGISVGGALVFSATLLSARAQVFTLDTNQSSITISGTVVGTTMQPQGTGSLTTSYAGTIQTAVTDATIQFIGQSLIQAQTNGSWQPLPDGSTGNAPADYGAQGTSPLGSGQAALRNVLFDVTSLLLNLTNNHFDSRNLTFFFPSNATSSIAYTVSGVVSKSGSKALAGYATNAVTTLATLSTVGNQQTLTIPVQAQYLLSLVTANDSTLNLQGQLVAVRTVAPPLLLQPPAIGSQTVTLQWQSAPGLQFQVQSSTDLVAWQTNAPNVTSATTNYSWTGPTSGTHQFFRIAH